MNCKLTSLVELRKKITIPETDYVEVTDNMLRLTYCIDGKEMHILLCSQVEAAEWLENLGFIKGYITTPEEVVLIEEQLSDVCDHNGDHVQKMVPVSFGWNDFCDRVDYDNFFTRDLMLHIAANHEYNKGYQQQVNTISAIPNLLLKFMLTNNRA